MQPLFDVA